MESFRCWFLLCVLPAIACGGTPAAPSEPAPTAPPASAGPGGKSPASSPWVFSLLPRSLQRNPILDITVVTEVTALGKNLAPVSPARPAYYVPYSAGVRQVGEVDARENSLKAEDVERILVRALATSGYLPARPPAQPPSLLIIYTWGSHNPVDRTDYSEAEGGDPNSPASIRRNLLDRAALVGGDKFAQQVARMMQDSDNLAQPQQSSNPNAVAMPDWASAFADPVHLYRLSDPKNEFLLDQATNELYFVVASAYDYQAAAANHRKLLWRTRMTVGSRGVSEAQSLPTLVATAAPYFGKDMSGPEVLFKRAVPAGNVEVGTPKVVELPATNDTPARPAKP